MHFDSALTCILSIMAIFHHVVSDKFFGEVLKMPRRLHNIINSELTRNQSKCSDFVLGSERRFTQVLS